MRENEIVSVVVITYNSAKYIIQTLESIKFQTYGAIELIISDDGSTDNTIDLCQDWLYSNGERFQRHEIVLVKKNTGVSSNCNRGVHASHGQWLKLCAGDDLLMKDCVLDNIEFIRNNPATKMIVSNALVFKDGSEPKDNGHKLKPKNRHLLQESVSALEQYNSLLIEYIEGTTSFFLSREVFNNVKYDERFPFLEDYPFALNATRAGFKFIYFDKDTVWFRLRDDSISKGNNKFLYNDFFRKIRQFDELYRHPYLDSKRVKMENFEFRRKELIFKYNLNRKTVLNMLLNAISLRLNPYR